MSSLFLHPIRFLTFTSQSIAGHSFLTDTGIASGRVETFSSGAADVISFAFVNVLAIAMHQLVAFGTPRDTGVATSLHCLSVTIDLSRYRILTKLSFGTFVRSQLAFINVKTFRPQRIAFLCKPFRAVAVVSSRQVDAGRVFRTECRSTALVQI